MDQSLQQFVNPLLKAMRRYHTTIVVVIIAVLLALAIFRLYQVVMISTEKGVEGYKPVPKANNNFDQKTIDRINNLRTVTDSDAPLVFPNRPSPFVE